MSNDESMSCDACGTTNSDTHVSCPYCHKARWCSVECRNGLGWSQHESSCNVMHELSELPSMPYAWQNAVANTGNTWDSQKEPFPAFLVRGPIDQHQLCFTQTVLPAIDKPPASTSAPVGKTTAATHTFSLSLNGQPCASEAKLRAPEHMICAESSQHAARTLAQSRAPRPHGKLYWVSERLQQNQPVRMHVDDVNTFTLTRDEEPRHVSFHFDESAVDVYQEQVYAKLGYGLKQFLASQYRAKGLGTSKRSLSTHYALNPATGDTVVFTVDNAAMTLVDAEYFAMDSPAPVRLQQQTFSVAPNENDPVDVQALCMAIEDRLDVLHHETDADALELRTQLQSHLQTLLDHLHRSDAMGIGSDVENILAVRAAINALHPLLWGESIGLRSQVERYTDELRQLDASRIERRFYTLQTKYVKALDRLEDARAKEGERGFKGLFRYAKASSAKASYNRQRRRLKLFVNAVKTIASERTGQDQKYVLAIYKQAKNLLKSGGFGAARKAEANSTPSDFDADDSTPPPVPTRDEDIAKTNAQMSLPDRQRVIPLQPIGAWIRQDTLRPGGSDKMVEWFDVDVSDVKDAEAKLRLTTRKTMQNVVSKTGLNNDETFYYVSPTNKTWMRSTGDKSGSARVAAANKLKTYTFPLSAASATPAPAPQKSSSLLTEDEKRRIFEQMDEYLIQKAEEEPSFDIQTVARQTYNAKIAMLDTEELKQEFKRRFDRRVSNLIPTKFNIEPYMSKMLDRATQQQPLSDAQYTELIDLYNRLYTRSLAADKPDFKTKFYVPIIRLNPQVTGTEPLPATPSNNNDDDVFFSPRDTFDVIPLVPGEGVETTEETPSAGGGMMYNAFKWAARGATGASKYVLKKMAGAASAVLGSTYGLSKNAAHVIAQAGVNAYEKAITAGKNADEAEKEAEKVVQMIAIEQRQLLKRNPNYPHPPGFRAARDPSRASGGAHNFRFVNASYDDDVRRKKKEHNDAYFPYDESLMPNGPAGRRHYY